VLLADDMGLGKTSTALWAAMEATCGVNTRFLVICPASVKFNWQKEVWATLGENWVLVIDGTAKQRADQFSKLNYVMNLDDGGFVIINYDLLIRLGAVGLTTLRKWVDKGTLICDESYYLKNRNSKRFKIIHENFAPATGGALGRFLLSGTPVRNRIDDLYAQIELIRPGTWTSYTNFCDRYLDKALVTYGPDKIVGGKKVKARPALKIKGAKNLDKLNIVVNTLQIRRKKEDVLDLPPKIRTFPELQLDGAHLKIYKAMKEWAILELNELNDSDGVFTPQAASAMVSAMRCEQIAQGFVGGIPDPMMRKLSQVVMKHAESIPDRPSELVFPESPKIAWLLETIESLWLQGARPVVFSRFNAPLVWLRHKFDKDSFMLHGGQSAKLRQGIIDGFQEGLRRLMLCQVKIAEGFNLTSSTDEIFHSRDWSPAVNAQAEDRCHRIGQKGTVNIQIPIVTNTVEKPIDKRLGDKADSAAAALKSLTVAELREML
jgi:SWI/SNF-related matrix-associated actin-dependent regulator 1 of chromatin subfamily A